MGVIKSCHVWPFIAGIPNLSSSGDYFHFLTLARRAVGVGGKFRQKIIFLGLANKTSQSRSEKKLSRSC